MFETSERSRVERVRERKGERENVSNREKQDRNQKGESTAVIRIEERRGTSEKKKWQE